MTKKMSILESEQLFKRKLSVVVSEINNLFNNSNNEIIEMLTNKNIKTRTNKLTFNDALLYKFKCAFENSYNKSIANEINFTKENINNIAHVSNYYRKEQQIPVKYYNDILIKIQELSKKYSSNSKLFLNLSNKELQEQQELLSKKLKLISVDGTYTNTNEFNKKTLETSLNMGYFDPINKVPVYLNFKGEKNKNKEIESLINDINYNNFDYTDSILILDRGYFSYDLMNLLESKNIKYVIRIKNNYIHFDKNKNINNKIINEKLNNIRFVNYIADVEDIKKIQKMNQ
jgi:hypothetical protein